MTPTTLVRAESFGLHIMTERFQAMSKAEWALCCLDRQTSPVNRMKLRTAPTDPRFKAKIFVREQEGPVDIIRYPGLTIKILKSNPFFWDGSYLGLIIDQNILATEKHNDTTFWRLNIFGHEVVCAVRIIKSTCPCISDELKVIFGSAKLGTHRVQYKNRLYVLIRARLDSGGFPIKEESINKVMEANDTFIRQVQDIFLFRDILGLTKSYESSVVVRQPSQDYLPPYPMSIYENKIDLQVEKRSVPETVKRRWFGTEPGSELAFEDIARRVFRVTEAKDVPARLIYLREQIESIIERVDRNAVWMVSPIIDRIARRILFEIDSVETTSSWPNY